MVLPIGAEETGGWKMVSIGSNSPRALAGIAYDSKDKVIYLSGGSMPGIYRNDLCVWDGTEWKTVAEDSRLERNLHKIVYDSLRDRLVFLSGFGYPQNNPNATLEWDGGNFIEITTSVNPGWRHSYGAAYDESRNKTVLFGGMDVNTEQPRHFLGDTWEWDGSNWKKVATTGHSPRAGLSMVFDKKRQKIILFGGMGYNDVSNGELWEWDGNQWTEISNDGPKISCHGMVYDENRKKIVVFGGGDAFWSDNDNLNGDTWEWNDSGWSKISTIDVMKQLDVAMEYDSYREKIVLFNGIFPNDTYSNMNITWEYTPSSLPVPDKTYTLDSADEFTRISGGFDGYAAGKVEMGAIPETNGFSDGQGATITVAKNQVELLLFPTMDVGDNMVLLRAAVQSDNTGAAISLAGLDGSMDGSIGTNQSADSAMYMDKYNRMIVTYDPPGNTYTPLIQVANFGNLLPVSVNVDTIEIFLLPKEDYRRFYGE